jgi:NADPH-dependent glutamate synthase beta subunit-like oxidoreductase/NAD-dependent dihydropyrimidine dehydrogenase PreA subunit
VARPKKAVPPPPRPADAREAVLIVGSGYGGLKIAENLAQSGIAAVWVTRSPHFLELPQDPAAFRELPEDLNFQFRPLYLRVTRHPLVTPLSRARLLSLTSGPDGFTALVEQDPQYIDYDLCTGCRRCMEVCPLQDGDHPPLSRSPDYCPSRSLELDKRALSPCRTACPLGVNVQAYMALTAAGRFDEALAVIRESNPLPGVCGRVCHHPCEAECRRREIDKPAAIRDIKRFLFDREAEQGVARLPRPAGPRRPERIAVIGSGPAGLTAAHYLNQQGFPVTVIEALAEAGGMLRAGINAFRLPRAVLDAEVSALVDSGVELRTRTTVSSLERLFEDGYQAVLIATGVQRDLDLNVPGEDFNGVRHCIEFLARLNLDGEGAVGARTLVIGGGNSAMDAARTALRLGALQVTVAAIESESELPASPREATEAREEGVVFRLGLAPVAIEGEGKVERVVFQPAHWEFKDGKPSRIVYDSEEAIAIEADTVIVAIGQRPDLSVAGLDRELEIGRGGRIVVDPALAASRNAVFAAGDAVTGPSTVIAAMAAGRRAAGELIARLLGGTTPLPELTPGCRGVGEPLPITEDLPTLPRQEMAFRQPKARRRDFEEVSLGLTASQAVAEARRCLQCGSCCECRVCETACTEVGAIDHFRTRRQLAVHAPAIVVADEAELPPGLDLNREGVYKLSPFYGSGDLMDLLVGATAVAGQAMVRAVHLRAPAAPAPAPAPADGDDELRLGLFICSCNRTMAPAPALERIRALGELVPELVHREIIVSACHPRGAETIARAVRDQRLSRVILASCVCCPLEFQCISCNDQRNRARILLFERFGLPRGRFEMINFRDHLLRGDPTEDAVVERGRELLRGALIRSRYLEPLRLGVTAIGKRILVLGGSEIGVSCANNLAGQGFDVRLAHRCELAGIDPPADMARRKLARGIDRRIEQVKDAHIEEVRGHLGDFTVLAKVDGERVRWAADVVCVTDQHLIPLTIHEAIQGFTKLYRHDFSFFHTPQAGLYRVMPRTLQRVSPYEAGVALAAEVATAAAEAFLKDHQLSPTVDPERCRGCGRCEEICPFKAVSLVVDDRGRSTARVVRYNCVGCGGCVGRCPVTAMDMPYFSNQLLKEMVVGVLNGERDGD